MADWLDITIMQTSPEVSIREELGERLILMIITPNTVLQTSVKSQLGNKRFPTIQLSIAY